MKIGDILSGRVVGIKPYGAFIELENGQTGLVHISEIKTGFIDNIHGVLSLGQIIQVQVIDIDDYDKKVSLSMRPLVEGGKNINRRHRFSKSHLQIGFKPLRYSLKDWITEGKEYLAKKESSQAE